MLTALLLLLACATLAATQGDKKKEGKSYPDFSGTWELDNSKSEFGPFTDRPLSRAESTLVVEHKEPELKIKRTLKLNGQEEVKQFAYYTDERGETNPSALGFGNVESKTKWDGGKVLARGYVTRQGGVREPDLDVTQRWQVSADGKALTNTTVIRRKIETWDAVEEVKLVYRRGQ